MKKLIVTALVVGLVASVAVTPAMAGKKKKSGKPVATTLYFHGTKPLGEIDGAEWFTALGGPPLTTLTVDEPVDAFPKSQALGNPALNTKCTGLPLGFPTFQGNLDGTIVGDAKITATFATPPGKVTARIWADVPNFSCNDGYIEPASEVVVDLPAGENEVEIVFPGLKLKAGYWILVELLGAGATYPGRLLYDSPSAATRIEFNCIPTSGPTCT